MKNYFLSIGASFWGDQDPGCPDKSDFSKDGDSKSDCGEGWFHCRRNNVCIREEARCDLHPHEKCLYNETGQIFSEDEESCFEQYKSKRLVEPSVNFNNSCQSLDHNKESPAITSTVFNWTTYDSFVAMRRAVYLNRVLQLEPVSNNTK